jgi:tetratricopeptide (TPR) repeat protein
VPTAPTQPAATEPSSEGAEGELARGALFGRYVLLDVIGEGGMGKVFAAYDASLDRNIALKIVRHAPERVAQAWLVREARAMARVQHPAIVAVHDVGSVGARVYIAMELVRGTTLRGWLDREPHTWREIVTRFVAAGRGLEAAHVAGVIHRDFKPENVLVDAAGRVRVSDFGLAELRGGAGVPASAGTPWYMAPEQYSGHGADAKSDQFAFCVSVWQAVYGEHPFAERESELPSAVTGGKLRPPSDRAPRWLAQLLRRGLAVDPAARHASMTELLAALERGLARRRRRVIVPAALVIAGAAIAAPIVSLHGRATGPTCASAGERAASVWSPAQRAALAKAPPGVLDAIDGYAHDWAAQRVDACRATHERGEQSEELLDLRMQCLDRGMDELAAVLGALDSPDTIAKAGDAIEALAPLTACEDVKSLRDVMPLPVEPLRRAQVLALGRAGMKVDADYHLGRFAQAYAAIQPLVKQAEAIGYDPLIAELELEHGVLAWHTDHMDIAETAIEHSLARSEAGRDSAASADAWLELIRFEAQERKRPDEALRLGAIAQGAIDRYAGDPDKTSMLAEQLGLIALDQERLDDAEHYLQNAYDIRVRSAGEGSIPVAASLQHLAMLASERKQHDLALELHRKSLAIFESKEGPDHPDTLIELEDYGAALYEAGKLTEALAVYRDGQARVERTLGPDGLDAAMYMHNIALIDTDLGRHDEAIALEQRSLAIFVRVRGPDAPDTIQQRGELERAIHAAGRK